MGALHAGHLALVRAARRRARRVVVSIFVNPAQFAPHEDLATYPRTFDADLAALAELRRRSGLGAAGRGDVSARISRPASCPRDRPRSASRTSFARISSPASPPWSASCSSSAQPDFAMFGEKDYQQLKVVTRLAKDLDLPVKIIGVPTVREKDGLALSSRNAYLSASERAAAPTLHRVLEDCAGAASRADAPLARVLDEGGAAIERAGFTLDYLEARHAETLEPIAVGRATDRSGCWWRRGSARRG